MTTLTITRELSSEKESMPWRNVSMPYKAGRRLWHLRPINTDFIEHALAPDGLRCASAAGEDERVCRAWHVACEVKVLAPGIGEAEGKRKGNCVIARWGGEEVQRKSTGRRTETGYKVWYTRDQRARDREVLRSPNGVCFINPAFTCGRLRVLPREACKASERTERGEIQAYCLAGVSRGHSS